MKQLHYPTVIFNIYFKNGKTERIKKSYGLTYKKPMLNKMFCVNADIDSLDGIMYKYPNDFIHYPSTFFKRNYKKQIAFYWGSNGYHVSDIKYIVIEETYVVCTGECIKYISSSLTVDEFLDYLYDKEQELKMKDIVNFIK